MEGTHGRGGGRRGEGRGWKGLLAPAPHKIFPCPPWIGNLAPPLMSPSRSVPEMAVKMVEEVGEKTFTTELIPIQTFNIGF